MRFCAWYRLARQPRLRQRIVLERYSALHPARKASKYVSLVLQLPFFEDYQRLAKQRRNIADALEMPDVEDVEFEPPRVWCQRTESYPF